MGRRWEHCVVFRSMDPALFSWHRPRLGEAHGYDQPGTGSATLSVTIPTSAGPEKVTFPVTIQYSPGIGFKYSDSLEGPFTFLFYPSIGNCVTAPVMEAVQIGQFVLKS
jgi:hypothetical protein